MVKLSWTTGDDDQRISECATMLRDIIHKHSHGSFTQEDAMHTIAEKFKLGYWKIWKIIHGKRSSISVRDYLHIRKALLKTLEESVSHDLARLEIEVGTNEFGVTRMESLRAKARMLLADIQSEF